ncbi:ROK family protein [Nonomuraea diastatica]|uniref:ROK family protein n=1 Tax=Nonomuraea diastatica TaxID=1848329 RepID=UPI00140B9FBE|nr:ROK family protein [Nonomuraea diastatica]
MVTAGFCIASALALPGSAHAADNPYQRGPDATSASVAASRGTVATANVSVPACNGFGGGVVVDGEVYRGSSSNGVAIGHITVDINGRPCGCGNYGCLANYADPSAVIEQALQESSLGGRLGLNASDTDVITAFRRIATAADAGDPEALTLIEGSGHLLGTAAVTMASLFDLDLIVLAGPSLAAAASLSRSVIEEEAQRRTFVRQAHPVRGGEKVTACWAAHANRRAASSSPAIIGTPSA